MQSFDSSLCQFILKVNVERDARIQRLHSIFSPKETDNYFQYEKNPCEVKHRAQFNFSSFWGLKPHEKSHVLFHVLVMCAWHTYLPQAPKSA